MATNRSVLGVKPKEGLSPFEVLRRQNERSSVSRRRAGFVPYPSWTRRVFALNALKRACGDWHHGVRFACSGQKPVSRHARNLFVNRP